MLSEEELNRYSRQIILPGFGSKGQEKLASSKVLVCGAGGLGSLVLFYLASSGIGNIGIVDFDKVELSNLPRQIIHFTNDIGKEKVLSASEKLKLINPKVNVKTYFEKLNSKNISDIFSKYEIIVDCLDTFKDKILLNDFSLKLNKILIHGGASMYEGQVLTIFPNQSACLRCLLGDSSSEITSQLCVESGILPTCAGIISLIQANEVLKIILNIGSVYKNKILKYNSLNGKFFEYEIKNNHCSCLKKIKANDDSCYED